MQLSLARMIHKNSILQLILSITLSGQKRQIQIHSVPLLTQQSNFQKKSYQKKDLN